MADDKEKSINIPAADYNALLKRLETTEAKLAALEDVTNAAPAEAVAAKPSSKATLTGETFKVGGAEYQVKFPVMSHEGKTITEADILADKPLQEKLVKGGFGIIQKVSIALLMMTCMFLPAQASTVTININSAEVVSTSFKTRDFYALGNMLIIYRASTEAFELQTAETRTKVWGGDIDSVTIAGASTAAAKLAFLRTLMFEATTTGGYRVFMGRSNIEFNYVSATNRLDVKYSRNKQPLWFGHIDSLQVSGLSTGTAKLAYLRLVNKYRAQDLLPTTSVATIAAGAAAGSSPTVTVAGDAFSGKITIVVGASGATTGVLATVTLKTTAPTGYRVAISPKNDNATLHSLRVSWSETVTTLVANIPATALTSGGTYIYDYVTVPY